MKPKWLPSPGSVKTQVKAQTEAQANYQVKPQPKGWTTSKSRHSWNQVKVEIKGQSLSRLPNQRSRLKSILKSNVKRLSSQHSVKVWDDFQVNARPKLERLPSQSKSQSKWLLSQTGMRPDWRPKTQVKVQNSSQGPSWLSREWEKFSYK